MAILKDVNMFMTKLGKRIRDDGIRKLPSTIGWLEKEQSICQRTRLAIMRFREGEEITLLR